MAKSKGEMSQEEIDQFLATARIGRLGLSLNQGPYIIPVGYVYANGKIAFHTCNSGIKMKALRENPQVCFEVDESLSDASMYKSVIIFGNAEILDDPEAMIPYLQLHIDKYRVPQDFEKYISQPGRNRDNQLAAVRIVVITPTKITGRKFVQFQ